MNEKYWAIYFEKGTFNGYKALELNKIYTKEEAQEIVGDQITIVSIVKEID